MIRQLSKDTFRRLSGRTSTASSQKLRRSHLIARPSIDGLDDRVLLTGNVSANLYAGVLTITGDPGNNDITIKPVLGDPSTLRVSGWLTSVNSAAYNDFPLSAITSVKIDMVPFGGKDKITLENFKVENAISFDSGGSGNDALYMTNMSANTITVNANIMNNASSFVQMTNTTVAGAAYINTGNGADSINLNGGRIGNVFIHTGFGNASDTVNVSNFVGAGIMPGIGQLQIITADGSDVINVQNDSLSRLNIFAGNGNNIITVDAISIRSSTNIVTGFGSDIISFKSPKAQDLTIQADGGYNTVTVQASQLRNVNIQNATQLTFFANNVTGSMLVGGTTYANISNTTIGTGDLNISAGNFAVITLSDVTLNSGSLNVSAGDYAAISLFSVEVLATGESLNVGVGNYATDIAIYNCNTPTMNISTGDAILFGTNITVAGCSILDGEGFAMSTGNGDFNVTLSDLQIMTMDPSMYQGMSILMGDGNILLYMVYVTVLDGMFINLGNGINTVAVDNVLTDYGFIMAGSGASDVIYDINPGSSSGFAALGFEGFI